MKAFAYIATRFESGQLIKIIAEDGTLLDCIEPRTSLTKLKEKIGLFAPYHLVEWLDRPWTNTKFKEAVRLYEVNVGMRMDCKEY